MTNHLGKRLRHLRMLTGESARGIARLAGLPAGSHVSWIEEHDAPDPRASTVIALANVYGVTIDWLLTGALPAFRTAPTIDPEFQPTKARGLVAKALCRRTDDTVRTPKARRTARGVPTLAVRATVSACREFARSLKRACRARAQTANDNAVDAAKGAA